MWLIVCPSTFTFCSINIFPMKHSLYNTWYGKLMVGCKKFYYILFAYCNLCKNCLSCHTKIWLLSYHWWLVSKKGFSFWFKYTHSMLMQCFYLSKHCNHFIWFHGLPFLKGYKDFTSSKMWLEFYVWVIVVHI